MDVPGPSGRVATEETNRNVVLGPGKPEFATEEGTANANPVRRLAGIGDPFAQFLAESANGPFVGVDGENPVRFRRANGEIPLLGERVEPARQKAAIVETRDLGRSVGGIIVHDHDFVDDRPQQGQEPLKVLPLVLHDEGGADARPVHGAPRSLFGENRSKKARSRETG